MMPQAIPLNDLAHRISQQEAELESLRREYRSRQEQMAQLNRRKQELTVKLHEVEAEISALGGNSKPSTPEPKAKAVRAKPGPKGKAVDRPSLPQTVVAIVREAQGRPLSTQQLTEEATRRGFTSPGLDRQIISRVSELIKKGILQRPADGAGVILKDGRARKGATKRGGKRAAVRAKASQEQRPLTEVLLEVLGKSNKPLGAQQLAKKILAAGYQTKSKRFANVIWVYLGKLKEVEKAPEGGYRLKKGKK